MTWTKVTKPSVATWTSVNPQGKEQYDQASLTYDSPTTYYDGVVPNQWTSVTKPVSSTWTKVAKPT